MRILFAASEAVPFCKTGGLADVAGVLAGMVGSQGHRVALFLPYYRRIREGDKATRLLDGTVRVPVGDRTVEASLRVLDSGPVTVFFVDCPGYFDRENLYIEKGRDYADNGERFAFFCRAVLEGARLAAFSPDVIHCHDWQTGLIPVYLKRCYRDDPMFRRTASLFTIHNMAYQGLFPRSILSTAGLPEAEFSADRLEYYGKAGYLKGAIVYSDLLNTVSPTYAREIQSSSEFGMGLEGVLRRRSEDLFGILNGLDLKVWAPDSDPHLPRAYGIADAVEGKGACRAALLSECGLSDGEGPVIGAVSRLDWQKGLDLSPEVLQESLDRGARFVLIGEGDPGLREKIERFARARADRVHFRTGFDEPFAHRVYAGSDMFFMPSRFEPCGLGQMIAMRYGTLPLATRTGGLADTVMETGPRPNGFLAAKAEGGEIRAALSRALRVYRDKPAWADRVKAAMETDSSWVRSVKGYLELYERARARVL